MLRTFLRLSNDRTYTQGKTSEEIVESCFTMLGIGKGLVPEELLTRIDALGLIENIETRDNLRFSGVRLYNVFRALEPTTEELVAVRALAVRCLEAGKAEGNSILLCYVRTALKILSENLGCKELAFNCLRRGFSVMSLKQALALYGKDATEDQNKFGASVFHGACELSFHELERSQQSEDVGCLKFLCKIWAQAMEELGTIVNLGFRKQTWRVARRIALALYEKAEALDLALGLFKAMEKWFPAEAFDEEVRLDDLVVIADMEILTGDRGLASATLDEAQLLLEEANRKQPDQLPQPLSWKAIAAENDEESVDDPARQREAQILCTTVKKRSVAIKLAAAELKTLEGTKELSSEAGLQHRETKKAVLDRFGEMLETLAECAACETIKVDVARASRIFTIATLCCKEICSSLGYCDKMIRETFLAMEKAFPCAPTGAKASMHVKLVSSLPADSSMICPLLESITVEDLAPSDTLSLADTMWKRLQKQHNENDFDGTLTTATYLIDFCKQDDVVGAVAELVLAEAMQKKKAWPRALEHAQRAVKLTRELNRSDLFFKSLVIEYEAAISQGLKDKANATLSEALALKDAKNGSEILQLALIASQNSALADVAKILRQVKEPRNEIWMQLYIAVAVTRLGLSPTDFVLEAAPQNVLKELEERNMEILLDLVEEIKQVEIGLGKGFSVPIVRWIQVATWRLACTCCKVSLLISGLLYFCCAKACKAVHEFEDASPVDEDKKRLEAGIHEGLCSLCDFVIEQVLSGVLEEDGVEPDSFSEKIENVSCVKEMLWLIENATETENEIMRVAKFVIKRGAPDFREISCEKMIQLAIFARNIGEHTHCTSILKQALQKEVIEVRPSGARLGKLLSLLVKFSEDSQSAIPWITQALQLQDTHSEAYFTQPARRYLSAWVWNIGVQESRRDGQQNERAQAYMKEAIKILRHCSRSHEDRSKADELEKRILSFSSNFASKSSR